MENLYRVFSPKGQHRALIADTEDEGEEQCESQSGIFISSHKFLSNPSLFLWGDLINCEDRKDQLYIVLYWAAKLT